MVTVGELIDFCKNIEHEYGSDTSVILQLYNEKGQLIDGDYCLNICNKDDGVVFLTNKVDKS